MLHIPDLFYAHLNDKDSKTGEQKRGNPTNQWRISEAKSRGEEDNMERRKPNLFESCQKKLSCNRLRQRLQFYYQNQLKRPALNE